MCRFIVTLAADALAIEKLKTSLPRPWNLVYGRKNGDGEWIAICEAPGAEQLWSEELGWILSNALGDTNFEWWEEKEYISPSAAEKAALERLKRQLAARQDQLSRIG